jgi:predicted RND superfamily exporter protein
MIHTFTQRLLGSFGPSIVIAVVLITAIMMWMLRSIKLGLVALLPNVVPLVVVLGAMSVLGYPIKPSTVLVISIAFGMAVDNTIHLLTRVTQHAERGGLVSSGLSRGLAEAGGVMIVTTAIVTAGFTLLVASHFTVLVLIGLMTAVTAVTALVADLFVLPSAIT